MNELSIKQEEKQSMVQMLPLKSLLNNEGQIEGLPKNPRFIRDHKFDKLVRSIDEDPELLILRELLVVPYGDKYVIIAGNMRFRAAKQLGYTKLPCKVIPEHVSVEKLQAIAIKDNIPYGEHNWEDLLNEWDTDLLQHWGLDIEIPEMVEEQEQPEQQESTKITLDYTYEDYLKVKESLSKISSTPEQAVWKLLFER